MFHSKGYFRANIMDRSIRPKITPGLVDSSRVNFSNLWVLAHDLQHRTEIDAALRAKAAGNLPAFITMSVFGLTDHPNGEEHR